MDTETEFVKFKLLLFGVILFIASTFMSCNEIRYAAWGKTADTMIFSKQEVSGRGRGSVGRLLWVRYQFDDGGTVRKEDDEVPLELPFPAVNMVTIQYIPGTESSRVQGHHQKWSLFVVVGSIGIMAWGAVNFWKFYKS